MRRDIFGLGSAQVLLTGGIVSAIVYETGILDWAGSVVAGFGLALSSTAFALQILDETKRHQHALWPAHLFAASVAGSGHRAAAGADPADRPAGAGRHDLAAL